MKNKEIAEIIFNVEGPRDHKSYKVVVNYLISKSAKELMGLVENHGILDGLFEVRIRWYSESGLMLAFNAATAEKAKP